MCGNLRPAFHAGLSVGCGTPLFGEAAGAVTSPGPGKGHVRALDGGSLWALIPAQPEPK